MRMYAMWHVFYSQTFKYMLHKYSNTCYTNIQIHVTHMFKYMLHKYSNTCYTNIQIHVTQTVKYSIFIIKTYFFGDLLIVSIRINSN